jgi:hypothetical protein
MAFRAMPAQDRGNLFVKSRTRQRAARHQNDANSVTSQGRDHANTLPQTGRLHKLFTYGEPAEAWVKWRINFKPIIVLSLLLASALFAADRAEQKVRVFDLNGQECDPFEVEKRAIVFIFLSVDCPISNLYAPEIERLKKAHQHTTTFRLIYPIADQSSAHVQKHLREYELSAQAFLDPEHALVRAAGVRVTPEVAVHLPGRGWVYRGRIDDRHVDFGRKRNAPRQRDLEELLREISGDGTIQPGLRVTKAVGCRIPEQLENKGENYGVPNPESLK